MAGEVSPRRRRRVLADFARLREGAKRFLSIEILGPQPFRGDGRLTNEGLRASSAVRRAVAGDRARISAAKTRLHAPRAQLQAELADVDEQIQALDERR